MPGYWSSLTKWIVHNGDEQHIDLRYLQTKITTYGLTGCPSPLHFACISKNTFIVKLLLVNGIDVNIRDHTDCTPLHWACCYGNIEIIKILLINGADCSSIDIDGNTPVHYAVEKGYLDIIKLFVEKCRFNMNTLNYRNRSIIDVAIQEEQIEILQYFIDHSPNKYIIFTKINESNSDFIMNTFSTNS